ncbi:rifin [Plasmodium reichenowi]|uniref:Rifin n=1 Tax=Plasmodium reichenowi TaxID=5854 RepID=A0A060RLW9_PLARE|nr:rifin [Plasmodium reichenowi]
MKVHYINILLFAHALNILVNTHKKTSISHHTQTNRSLCECDLYMPNYDSDPEMKEVMEIFNVQAQQRFHEYDERMQEKRKQCKDQCDKESQKIILKDKLEKELMDKFVTLQTDIQSDAIPTCVCEKSVADKVEKGCLRCAQNLGGIVVPSSGVIGEIAVLSLIAWKTTALEEATQVAIAKATKAATHAGVRAVKLKIQGLSVHFTNPIERYFDMSSIVNGSNFKSGTALVDTAKKVFVEKCKIPGDTSTSIFCNSTIYEGGESTFNPIAEAGIAKYDAEFASQKALLETRYINAVKTAYGGYNTSIIAPIIAIVVIVLIMVIIYLILRYRRKKKMKKKLQYIKLLEE